MLGCELWLAKEWANGEVRMNCKDVQVVLAKPRILHVSLTATSLKVDVVVTHAPHHGRPEDEQAGFWDDLDRVMRGLRLDSQRVILADTNAHVCSVGEGAFGKAPYKFGNRVGCK